MSLKIKQEESKCDRCFKKEDQEQLKSQLHIQDQIYKKA